MNLRPQRLTATLRRAPSWATETLRARVATVRAREAREQAAEAGGARAAAAADPIVAELALAGGYLVCPTGPSAQPLGAGGLSRPIGDRVFHVRTPLATATTASGASVTLLGHPVDIDASTTDLRTITDSLATRAGCSTSASAAVLQVAANLGGRWTLFLQHPGGGLTVLTDAQASQPVWFSSDGVTIGSHEALVADGTLLPVNTVLDVTVVGATTHPVEFPDLDPAEVSFEQFEARLVEHVRLIASTGRAGIALTGGPASRAVLAAYLRHRTPDGFAFTHFSTESVRTGGDPVTDMFEASALAHRLGVRHRVLRAIDPPAGSVFELAYRRAFPHGTTIDTAFARHQLPAETVELHSAGAESAGGASWPAVDRSVLNGDLGHRVALPFNDRRLLQMLLRQPQDESLVGRLAQTLDENPSQLPPAPTTPDRTTRPGP